MATLVSGPAVETISLNGTAAWAGLVATAVSAAIGDRELQQACRYAGLGSHGREPNPISTVCVRSS